MITWRLKKGAGESLRRGHPWGFAKEFDYGNTANAHPGSFVRVVDDKNNMVSFGYGNSTGALSFRRLPIMDHPKLAAMASVGPQSADFQAWVSEQIVKAWTRRRNQGFRGSYRIVFSEADGLPGLILDRYELTDSVSQGGQVLAAQILTAGMENIWGEGAGLMQKVVAGLGETSWEQTIVVERKDVSIRKLEGLAMTGAKILHFGSALPEASAEVEEQIAFLNQAAVQVQYRGANAKPDSFVELKADLYGGQKTGFFLDQSQNMEIVLQHLRKLELKELRVLDLCSYVGHWSLQLGQFAKERGIEFSSALVDVSSEALKRASSNLTAAGLKSECFELDVMKEIKALPAGPFDVVIADPPAFVKAKKDLPQGLHAYLKLNTEAALRVKPGGLLVTCSCSGAVSEEDLLAMMPKVLQRSGREGRLLARGQQGLDHPWDPCFPEGRYLKMLMTEIW